uniref:Uncharacterized protein n=1 Tax=Anopheles merus TaxID=30066 RepID=A0A182VFY3_ANOME
MIDIFKHGPTAKSHDQSQKYHAIFSCDHTSDFLLGRRQWRNSSSSSTTTITTTTSSINLLHLRHIVYASARMARVPIAEGLEILRQLPVLFVSTDVVRLGVASLMQAAQHGAIVAAQLALMPTAVPYGSLQPDNTRPNHIHAGRPHQTVLVRPHLKISQADRSTTSSHGSCFSAIALALLGPAGTAGTAAAAPAAFSAARRCFAWLDSRSSRVRRTLKKSTSTWLCSYSPEAVLIMYGPNRSPSRNLCGPVLQNTHIQLVSVVSASYLVLSVLTCRPRILLRSELFRLLPNFFVLCCVFSPSSSLIGVLMTVWLPLDLTCTYGPRYFPPPPASVLDVLLVPAPDQAPPSSRSSCLLPLPLLPPPAFPFLPATGPFLPGFPFFCLLLSAFSPSIGGPSGSRNGTDGLPFDFFFGPRLRFAAGVLVAISPTGPALLPMLRFCAGVSGFFPLPVPAGLSLTVAAAAAAADAARSFDSCFITSLSETFFAGAALSIAAVTDSTAFEPRSSLLLADSARNTESCIPDAAGNPSSSMPFSVPALSAKNLDAIAVVADTMAAILSIVSQSFIAAAAVPLSLPSSAATATGGSVLFALILLWMRDSSSFCWSGDASASGPAFRKSSCGKSFACG